MIPGLLPRRDVIIWSICLLAVSAVLVGLRFSSDDPDSALYAAQAARLAEEPLARWIAPEWWGNWNSEGLFREHPVGVLLAPALLAAAGVPGVQAAYIIGITAGLVSVVLIAALVARLTSVGDGRATLVLLQLMPLAFIFRIRANHEYPMLVCLLLALVGIEAARRSWRWIWITPVALCAAVLVKAAFVAVPLVAVGWWLLLNPLRTTGSPLRAVAALALSAVAVVAMATAYDAAYVSVTGESFWGGYWARQMAPLSIGVSAGDRPGMLHHLGFYGLRLLWHPAPWSFALLAAAWSSRRGWLDRWRQLPAPAQRGLLFCLAFVVTTVVMLMPASRFAERYLFSANYVVAAAGAVIALRQWPALRRLLATLDARIPALPAVCWTSLMLLRLLLGPILPRLSW